MTLVTTILVTIGLSIIEDLRVKKHGRPNLTRVAFVAGAIAQPVVVVATGGVLSPVILAMLMIAFVASTLLERRVSLLLVAIQVLCIASCAVLEYSQVLGPLLPEPFRGATAFVPPQVWLLVWTCVASFLFMVVRALGLRIQSAFGELLLRVTRARDETLRMHGEQLSELMQLTGEIAHELKNPLASVKGLAALLARRSAGQEPEPLRVLRHEVDRMQNILEEFLNYSRPLVPLNLQQTDIYAVIREVVALHEGLTETREVAVAFDTDAVIEIECDPRKIRQILVNLMQNALDACAARGSVSIHVHAMDDKITIELDDSGAGLPSNIASRVFDAGVTSKPGGSGLGLNVARALARQHGGDVSLCNRPEGGCRAALTLPLTVANSAAATAPLGSSLASSSSQPQQGVP